MNHETIHPGGTARYDRIAILLHWLIGVACSRKSPSGFCSMTSRRAGRRRAGVINLHKSFGIVLGLATFARLAWRLAHRPPP